MSTSSQPIIFKYTANGVNTTYPYLCHVLQKEDIHLFVNNIYQDPSTYSVTGLGNEAGGTVVTDIAYGNGSKVTIFRYVTFDRITNYGKDSPFLPETVNDDQDDQEMQIQQLVEQLSRVFQLPVGTNLGYCSKPQYTDQTTCVMNGGQWITGAQTTGYPSGGYCSIVDYVTQADCEDNEGTWYPANTVVGYCSDPQWTTQATCQLNGDHWITNGGYCSNIAYNNKPACIANGGTWTSQIGYCSNPAYTNQADCIDNEGTWTVSGAYCSIQDYDNEADCLANGGEWIVSGTNSLLPPPVADGIWKWNSTGTAIEYIFKEDLIQEIIDDFPLPTPENLAYYGWNDVGSADPQGESSVLITGIDETAEIIQISLQNINIDGNDGLAIKLEVDGVIATEGFSVITNHIAPNGTISRQDSEYDAFDALTAGTYACVAKAPASNPVRANITIAKKLSDSTGWDIIISASNNSGTQLSINLGSGRFSPSGDITGVQLISSNGNIFDSIAPMNFQVRQYSKNLTLGIESIISDYVSEDLMAEYGNLGTYFVNTGTDDDLVLEVNGSRTKYPPLIDGQAVWFLATGNNTGPMTAQVGPDGEQLDLVDEDENPLDADTFAEGYLYRIYKMGNYYKYAIPAVASIGNKSITLAKIADGDPDTYLGFDSEGVAAYLPSSGGAFSDTYEDSEGVTYNADGQSVEWTHGLGDYPFGYLLEAECTTTDGGYAVGQRINLGSSAIITAEGGVNRGLSLTCDDTKIYLKVAEGGIRITKADGSGMRMSHNKWKFLAKAWI